jgi:general secretion pathway protein M
VSGQPSARWTAPAQAWWRGLARREQTLVSLAAAVLVLGALWAGAVQPAWRTLARAPTELDALDAQLQAMQRLANEAQQLRAAPPVSPDQAAAALKAATARLGDKGRLAMQGDRAVLTLNGVGTAALRDWLTEVRAGARARPVEANLTRGAAGTSGTLVVAIGGGP